MRPMPHPRKTMTRSARCAIANPSRDLQTESDSKALPESKPTTAEKEAQRERAIRIGISKPPVQQHEETTVKKRIPAAAFIIIAMILGIIVGYMIFVSYPDKKVATQ